MEMFAFGIALGLLVLVPGLRRPAEVRQRLMNDAQAVGYRAALGDDPLTMRIRRHTKDV